jgi:hypothetical protein
MSVWVLHQKLTLEEEQHILERTHLALPFEGLPDLSMINNQFDCQSLLRALHPELPPEVIALKADGIWNRFHNLNLEDSIVVPLPLTAKVAIAQISGPYAYQVGEEGSDCHLIPVTWFPKLHLFFAFGRQRHILANTGIALYEVTDVAAKRAIISKLPFRYNRFTGWKWWWVWGFIGILIVKRVYEMLAHGI